MPTYKNPFKQNNSYTRIMRNYAPFRNFLENEDMDTLRKTMYNKSLCETFNNIVQTTLSHL